MSTPEACLSMCFGYLASVFILKQIMKGRKEVDTWLFYKFRDVHNFLLCVFSSVCFFGMTFDLIEIAQVRSCIAHTLAGKKYSRSSCVLALRRMRRACTCMSRLFAPTHKRTRTCTLPRVSRKKN
jgi:hypothetical protein